MNKPMKSILCLALVILTPILMLIGCIYSLAFAEHLGKFYTNIDGFAIFRWVFNFVVLASIVYWIAIFIGYRLVKIPTLIIHLTSSGALLLSGFMILYHSNHTTMCLAVTLTGLIVANLSMVAFWIVIGRSIR